jgi:death-on-curing protein
MRLLTLAEVVELHDRILAVTRGATGIRDLAGLESAIAQPRATFEGRDLYPGLIAKAAALAYSLARNHPFVDGNKRTAHAAMETFLVLNGHEIDASVDEQERLMKRTRDRFDLASRTPRVAWGSRALVLT